MAFLVTDIKQTCLGQGLGVPRENAHLKLMFTMKDLGHTLPGHLLVRKSNIFNYLKKSLIYHSVK